MSKPKMSEKDRKEAQTDDITITEEETRTSGTPDKKSELYKTRESLED
ncbi:hypothetical protein GX563_07340 [Candidatus Bathyarchaeota archaeon]|nr:hypothetical protein [Candidatus Bathyarchaeota archaeon]